MKNRIKMEKQQYTLFASISKVILCGGKKTFQGKIKKTKSSLREKNTRVLSS